MDKQGKYVDTLSYLELYAQTHQSLLSSLLPEEEFAHS